MLLWHEANAVMLSSRPDLVSLFATPLCQGEVPTCSGITRASWPHSESAHALGTPRVSHIRQGRWSFAPSLAIIWQSIQESGADKRLCQTHGKHCVSADNTRMGKEQPTEENTEGSWRQISRLTSSAGSSRSPLSFVLLLPTCPPRSTLQVQAGPGSTGRCRSALTVTHGLPLLIFTHCLNKVI